jgi:hypothetical protein
MSNIDLADEVSQGEYLDRTGSWDTLLEYVPLSQCIGEAIMASGGVVNQGKGAFVEKYFTSNPDGNLESVNKAWVAAGNDGKVSESLVGKVRSRLGLTGKKAVDEPMPIEAPKAKTKPVTKAKKVSKPIEKTPPSSNGAHVPAESVATTGHDDDDVLDELEEGIDELIHRLRGLGGKPEVVKALRRARRLLVRSHEG